MFESVKAAFGEFMGRFYGQIVPTTKSLHEYTQRGLAKSVAWAPSRMVDAAEQMLAAWQKNATEPTGTRPASLPVMLVAVAKDYTPTGRDYTRQVADRELVMIPTDPKERIFGLRTVAGDIRAQIAIFAHDEPTAKSLASQLLLFLDANENRRFTARYDFAGQTMDWPVQLETPDAPAMSIQSESNNLTILAIDITLKATVPLFDAPAYGQPNDGQGTPETDDPAGYPKVFDVGIEALEAHT